MSADRNDGARSENSSRFSGRMRVTPGRGDQQQTGLRDAIAFLNRDSVALPPPEMPPWAQQPQQPDPPLAPVRELRPGVPGRAGGPGSPVVPGDPRSTQNGTHRMPVENGPQFTTRRDDRPTQSPERRIMSGGPEQPHHEMERRLGSPAPVGPVDQHRDGGINAFANIDWTAVDLLRKQVRDRVTEQFPHRDAGTEAQRRVFGMAVIEEAVNSWYARSLSRGLAPSDTEQHTMRRAVGASVFGMGRLTPLLEHGEIENIEYRGCDDGYVVYSDGRVEKGPPIADSDEALLSDLQYWAAKQNRTLSASTPHLYLTLEDGARLTATIGTCKRPNLVIRRHRVVDVTLDDLVARGMVSASIAAFLRAAVLANCNIVITGPLNSGKTTLLRALAAEIPQMERYATLETEYELHLDEVGRHPRMVAYQALVGTAEQGYNGRRAGEVTLTDIMEVALRMNFTRLIVGEIRGAEVVAMLEAVSTGGRGSLCTMHANSARDVFGRFVTLCTRTNMSRDAAVQLAAESLHYIVNVQMDAESATGLQNTRSARRFVDQIVEVNGMGDGVSPSATDVFSPGQDGRGVFSHRPERLVKLQKAGFDPNWLMYGNDQWMASGGAGSEHVTREAPAQHHAQTVESPFARRGVPEPSPHATEMAQQLAAQEQFDRQYLQGRQRLDHYADAPAQEEQGFRPEYGRGAGDDRRGGGRGYR
jgi:Flp pilus assembly CpaF family ATPase